MNKQNKIPRLSERQQTTLTWPPHIESCGHIQIHRTQVVICAVFLPSAVAVSEREACEVLLIALHGSILLEAHDF